MSDDSVQDHPGGYRDGDVILAPCTCPVRDDDCADGFHARIVSADQPRRLKPGFVPAHAGDHRPEDIWLLRRTVWRFGDCFLLYDGDEAMLVHGDMVAGDGPGSEPRREWACRMVSGLLPGSKLEVFEDDLSRMATPVLKGDVRMPFMRSTEWWRRHVWAPW